MTEIFLVYLIKDALEVLRYSSAEKIELEIFGIIQMPKNRRRIMEKKYQQPISWRYSQEAEFL